MEIVSDQNPLKMNMIFVYFNIVNGELIFRHFYHQVFDVFSKQSPKNLPTALRTEQKVVFDAEFTVGSMLIFKHFNILENNSWFSRKNKLYYIV